MTSVIQGLLVDRIGKQVGVNYIIDVDGGMHYRGQNHATGAILISSSIYYVY